MNILWLHDNINDHIEIDKQLKNFEKPIINFTDSQSCISFLTNSEHQNNDRPSILIVLNRIGRQIVPEIHSYRVLLFIISFCTKNDNKIKWASKYTKIKGIFINPKELTICLRQVIKMSDLIKPFPCQLVLLDDHFNETIQQQLYRLDSSLIVFKKIHLCLTQLRSVTYKRPLILITVNTLGRQIVPEIHSDNQLKSVFIYYFKNDRKIKWTTKYDKIKLVTMNIIHLINGVRSEGLYYSALLYHIVCLDDHNDQALRDRLYELDPCITTFDQFDICQKYLQSANETNINTKPILFIAINRMGRQFIPEIHSNDQLKAFYIFISSDSNNDQKIKWTTKYNKIKHVCTDLNQLITYIKQDVAVLSQNIIQNHQNMTNVSTSSIESAVPVSSTARRPMIENNIVCWLDSNIDETNNDYQYSITKIRQIVHTVVSFRDPDECIDFLTDSNEKVFLIISGIFDPNIIPLMHETSQLNSICVFCVNKSHDTKWTTQYAKIKGVFTQIEPICEVLNQDVHQTNHDSIAISFIQSSDSFMNIKLDQLDSSYMYTQLFKEILLDIKYDETAIKEFVNYCRELYVGNDSYLRSIDRFEREYYHHQPIWWYTYEFILYPIMNRALRTLDTELILKMGFFICDLHRNIEQLYTEQISKHMAEAFTVYRGQGLLQGDFDRLMTTKGGLISFNSFLSTSMDRSISSAFAESNQSNPDLVGVLFQITINPSISSTPFALIDDYSYFQKEQEILFSMHTVFRIGEIRMMNDRLYQVELTLTGDNDRELQALTEHIRRNIESGTGFQRLGALMLEIGEYDKAIEVYEALLSTVQSDEDRRGISSVYNQLGAIYSRQGDLDKALTLYNKSLQMKLTYLSPNDPSLSPIYSNIGSVLRNQNQLIKALEYMERALNTELQATQPDPLKIASYHNNIGLVLTDENKYEEALIHYEQALEIQQKYLPSNHPDLGTSYNNIGAIYNELQIYNEALTYYEKSLEIMQRTLPFNHPDFAILYSNLGAIYNELQDYTKALSYYEKSMEIIQKSLPSNHPSLALAYHNMALTHYRLYFYELALGYCKRAIEIYEDILEPNNPQMIACQETFNAICKKL